MSTAGISVLVVEDDSMVRSWIRLCLEGTEFRFGGEAESAEQATELVERRKPDVLLVDYRLPDRFGTQLVRDLRVGGCAAPAIVMTANLERGLTELSRESGAQGTVLKSGSIDELLQALRTVAAGGIAFDVRHPKRRDNEAALTPREREVLLLVAGGATNREIAEKLGVGTETVKTLLSRTCSKLGVSRRTEAVSAAHNLGLL